MQGLGEDVLADVLRCSRPSHVIMLQTPNACRNVPLGRFWLAGDDAIGPLAAPGAAQQAAIIQLPAVPHQGPLGSMPAGAYSVLLRNVIDVCLLICHPGHVSWGTCQPCM